MTRGNCAASIVFMLAVVCALGASAQEESLSCTNYIIVIADSGLVVSELNADEPRAPASMVKMMLMLLVVEGVEDGRWRYETEVLVTKDIQMIGGTQVFLEDGESWPLESLMRGIAVASANDAAAAVAEGLWGTREEYLKAANARALELGMLDTEIHSPHGLPPEEGQESDVTTARDMALLARACVAKPKIMEWVGIKELTFRPGDETKTNTNKLIEQMPECDGLKTGYTRAAGFCLTATALRNDVRLIVVVMGCSRLQERFDTAQRLFEEGFAQTRHERILAKGDLLEPTVPVRNSKTPSVRLEAAEDLWVTVRKSDLKQLQYVAHYPQVLRAPMKAGDEIGTLSVELAGYPLTEVPVRVPHDLEVPGWRWKMTHSVVSRLNHEEVVQGG